MAAICQVHGWPPIRHPRFLWSHRRLLQLVKGRLTSDICINFVIKSKYYNLTQAYTKSMNEVEWYLEYGKVYNVIINILLPWLMQPILIAVPCWKGELLINISNIYWSSTNIIYVDARNISNWWGRELPYQGYSFAAQSQTHICSWEQICVAAIGWELDRAGLWLVCAGEFLYLFRIITFIL